MRNCSPLSHNELWRRLFSFPSPIRLWERVPAALTTQTRWLPTLILVLTVSGIAHAAEPRPWLCRDKPVFSSSGASRMDLNSHDGRRWQIFLMQFDPSGGHDGFTVTDSYDVGPGRRQSSVNVPAGRFFAVALYNSGGRWICSGPAHDERAPGTIADLCYSASGGACDVTLTVRSAK